MIETAARGAQFLLAIGIAYVIALWFALVAWTFRDIEARSRSVFTQVFSTLLVVLFFVPGLLLYLILRPKETLDQAFQRALEEEYLLQDLDDLPLCPGCQRSVDAEFVLCPHCQTHLRGPCPSCTRLIDVRWSVCPYCATPVEPGSIARPGPGIESVRVLDDAREGRRRRAVAAAARRVGAEPDEIDALTDALSGAPGPAAVGAGGPGRQFGGVRARFGSLGQVVAPFRDTTEESESEHENGATSQTGSSFWADPMPGQQRPGEPPSGN